MKLNYVVQYGKRVNLYLNFTAAFLNFLGFYKMLISKNFFNLNLKFGGRFGYFR